MKRVLLWIMLLTGSAGGTNYYVDTAGSDSNDGLSVGNPWKTLKHACSTVTATDTQEDTVFIRAGTYNATHEGWNGFTQGSIYFRMHPKSGYSATVRCVWMGYPGDAKPRIEGSLGASPSIHGITLWDIGGGGRDNLVFRDLIIAKCLHYGMYEESSDNITVVNCDFDSIDGSARPNNDGQNSGAIVGNNAYVIAKNWIVDSCTFNYIIENNSSHGSGITFYSVDSLTVSNCTFTDVRYGFIIKQTSASSPPVMNIHRNIHIHNNVYYEGDNSKGNAFCRLGGAHNYRIYIHHNVAYPNGSWPGGWRVININECQGCSAGCSFDDGDTVRMSHILVYNNTIDCAGTSVGIASHGAATSDDTKNWNNSIVANNIIVAIKPATTTNEYNTGAIAPAHKEEDGSCGATADPGSNLSWQFNMVWDTATTGRDLVEWRSQTLGTSAWTLAELETNVPACSSNVEDNPEFIDRSNRDYRITGSSPAATSGHGSYFALDNNDTVWLPSYMGAFEPMSTTCPVVTIVWPFDNDTIEAYHADLTADFQTDAAGDDIIVTVFGEVSDATPDVLIHTDTLGADSANWQWNWSGLLEDSTYYWQIIATDTSCEDISSIRHFHVDSIPDIITDTATGIEGVTLEGVQVGAVFDHSEQTFSNEVQTDGRYEVCSATGRRRFACDPDWCAVRQDQ